MARREKSPKQRKSRLGAVKGAVTRTRTEKKVAARLKPAKRRSRAAVPKRPGGDGRAARPIHRETDIPLDVLDRTYIPKQTSLKASFRISGDDRERDQDFAGGYADERWNDEDRFTNKSGDPRIGTHRRKYEPGE